MFVGLRVVGQSPHLQALGHVEDGDELCLPDLDLPPVHVLQQQLQVAGADVLQEDDVLLRAQLPEQALEVGTADAENKLVGFEYLVPSR